MSMLPMRSRCRAGAREEIGRETAPGHDDVRVELDERLEDEAALVQARMRHREPRLVDRLVAVQEQVEVDRPRPVARPVARASELALDLEQALEQRARGEPALDLGRG